MNAGDIAFARVVAECFRAEDRDRVCDEAVTFLRAGFGFHELSMVVEPGGKVAIVPRVMNDPNWPLRK